MRAIQNHRSRRINTSADAIRHTRGIRRYLHILGKGTRILAEWIIRFLTHSGRGYQVAQTVDRASLTCRLLHRAHHIFADTILAKTVLVRRPQVELGSAAFDAIDDNLILYTAVRPLNDIIRGDSR